MKYFSIGRVFVRLIFILYSLLIIFPFAMLLLTSFKTNEEFFASIWSIPAKLQFNNYVEVFIRTPLHKYFMNTVIVCAGALIWTLTLSFLISYAIARRNIKYANIINLLLVFGLMIPGIIAITPLFLMSRLLGLFNTRFILILTYGTATIPFCVLILTSFLKTLPRSLESAATIDGANNVKVMLSIIAPLAKPGFITAGLFCFLDYWSEYMWALMFVGKDELMTISVKMLQFKVVSGFKVDWGVVSAACIIFILPVLFVYIIFQSRLVEGLTAGSVKG